MSLQRAVPINAMPSLSFSGPCLTVVSWGLCLRSVICKEVSSGSASMC